MLERIFVDFSIKGFLVIIEIRKIQRHFKVFYKLI